MAGVAQQLKLRLFIEGVEVPVIAANVQCAPNSPAMCSLQIPPLAEGTRFLPRSLVHLYFLDLYEAQSPFVSKRGPSQHATTPSTYEQGLHDEELGSGESVDSDVRNDRYKLLFGGEVVGFGWTKNAAQRSLVLQCQDWSNYWDYAYQFNNTDLFGPGIKAMFSGGSTNLFDDFMTDEGTQIIQLLMTRSAQYPKLEGLLGGIVHLLESIGGSYYYEKKYAGQNMFYSLAELRLHISQMITAFPGDPTAMKLLGAGYDSLFGRTLGNLGAQVSFRQAINALMSAIFHETYAIPTPKYTPGTGNTVNGSKRQSIRKHPTFKGIASEADSNAVTCESLGTQLQVETVDTFFGDQVAAPSNSLLDKILGNVRNNVIKTLQVTAGTKELQGIRGFLSSALGSVKNAIAAAKKYKQTPVSAKPMLPHLKAAAEQFRKVGQFTVTLNTAAQGIPARLNQQIFRPDVWFASPPRCNVLFPDHYTQMDYQRMFLLEPTRMLLKTNDEFFGEDELFDKFFFAPKVPTVKSQQKQLQAVLGNDLMPHELFTGILPVFEKMGELNIFAARTGWTSEGTEPKIGLAQRSVNFLYFKHRFAARQMSVTARFNPYIVPGFPGLIIDKYVDLDNLVRHQELVKQYAAKSGLSTNPDIDKLLGTHFLGNFTQVTHTVDQRSGRTDIQCGFPRQHDETTEFLGSAPDGQTIKKREGFTALRATDVAVLNPPKLGSLGPNYGIVRKITEVTDKYKSDPVSKTPTLPFFAGGRRQGSAQAKVSVPVGLTLLASEYSPEVVKIAGDPKQPVRFSAFTVEEEIPRYRKEKVDLGAEELIRPGWYGDCWRPDRIGEVYDHFFSTGAITDMQTVADPGGASTGAANQEPDDAVSEDGSLDAEIRGLAPALLMLDKGATVQQAVGFLVQLYSYVKQGGLDTEEFIRGYVWRPIATMVDMFGSSNLTFDSNGEKAIEGIEGFHSRAFGPHENLFGLVLPEIDDIVGIKRKKSLTGQPGTSSTEAAARADVRKRRQDLVKEYVSALRFSRAILG